MIGTILDFNDVRLLLQGMVLYRNEDGTPANPPAGKTTSAGHALKIAINPNDLRGLRQMIPRELWESPDVDRPAKSKRRGQA